MRRLIHTPVRLTLVLAAIACGALGPEALAAPPPNDDRAAAQDLGTLPADVRGTTVETTLGADEPSSCRGSKDSVWYAFTAPESREVLVAVDAAGELDASVDVYERQRSQTSTEVCGATDRRGQATLELDAVKGHTYLIRVGALSNSVDDAFRLRVVAPDRPAQPPGPGLSPRGVAAQVDRLSNPDDSWSVRLTARRTYRINFVSSGSRCATAELYPAHVGSFDGPTLRSLHCDRHIVFTPPVSGRYSLLVRAPRATRAVIHYRLRVGLAGPDDTAPGLALANDVRRRGSLQGSELDAVDLYRFTVANRSELQVRLRTSHTFDVVLLREGGGRLGCGCGGAGPKEIRRVIPVGIYFLAVRARDGADGSYVLSRLARTVTRSQMLVDGRRFETVPPGSGVQFALNVTPAVSGRATLLIERFDPLSGWLFYQLVHATVVGGRASLPFQPPSVGRWRVTGTFEQNRRAGASFGGIAEIRVAEPLGTVAQG